MRILIALALVSPLLAQPVVSGIIVDDYNVNQGHSSFRVTWNSDVTPDNQRVQWGPTSAYGRVIYAYAGYGGATYQQMVVSGLQGGVDMDSTRTVHLCPQSHNAAGWSSCTGLDQAIVIPPVPAVHPIPPQLPITTIITPNLAGCTAVSPTVTGDLANLQTAIDNATAGQPSNCQVITVTPNGSGANQGGGGHGIPYPNFPPAADADIIPNAGMNGSTNFLTPSTSVNSYSTNGTHVRFSGAEGGYPALPSNIYEGADYYTCNYSAGSFQVSLSPTCSPIVSIGTVVPPYGYGPMYVMPYPAPHSNYIYLVCGSTNPPYGVQMTPQFKGPAQSNRCPWLPNSLGYSASSAGALYINSPAHHIYIGPGFDFTMANSNQASSGVTDPAPWPSWITSNIGVDHLAIKQNWFTGLGYPERTIRATGEFEGSNIDISENYITNMEYWNGAMVGMAATGGPTLITIGSGSLNMGAAIGNCPSVPSYSFNLTSQTTGNEWFSLDPSTCQPYVTIPSGTTGNCNGCLTQSGTGIPVNGAGNWTQMPVGYCAFTSGTINYCIQYNATTSAHLVGGPQQAISYGPGPFRFANNYYSGHGNGWHFDDTATFVPNYSSTVAMMANVTFQRNTLVTPAQYQNGGPGSDGLYYYNRNPWECKRCKYVLLDGNEFYGNYHDINQGSPIVANGNAAGAAGNAFNPVQYYAGDFTVTNNLLHDSGAGIQFGGGNPNATAVPQLGRRLLISNNLLYGISGYTHNSVLPGPSGGPNGVGYCFEISFGFEDVVIDHNTCYSPAGTQGIFFEPVAKMVEGFQFTNNALYFHEDSGFHGANADWGPGTPNPSCWFLHGTALMNCFGNGAANVSNNLLIPGFLNSQTMGGDSPTAPVIAAWTSPNTYIPTNSTVVNRIAASQWANVTANPAPWSGPVHPNLRFTAASPYIAGGHAATDGADLGANVDQLEDHLGRIKNVRVSNNITSPTISFHAPDSGVACYIAYGTGPRGTTPTAAFDPFTWSLSPPDTSASQERSIMLTGLTPRIAYFYQVWCAGTAPTPTYSMRTVVE